LYGVACFRTSKPIKTSLACLPPVSFAPSQMPRPIPGVARGLMRPRPEPPLAPTPRAYRTPGCPISPTHLLACQSTCTACLSCTPFVILSCWVRRVRFSSQNCIQTDIHGPSPLPHMNLNVSERLIWIIGFVTVNRPCD
jgi:hypothetical protein